MRSEMRKKLDNERRVRKIEAAIVRLKQNEPIIVPKDSELNITNVAKEARVSRTVIYNQHFSLIETIKHISGKKYSERKVKPKRTETMQEAIIRELRKEIRKLHRELAEKDESIERYRHSIGMHEVAYNELKEKLINAKSRISELELNRINRI